MFTVAGLLVILASATAAVAATSGSLNPQNLVLQIWSFPTAYVAGFHETENRPIAGADGWETQYEASSKSGLIVIHSTAIVFRSPSEAHHLLADFRLPGAKLVLPHAAAPTSDSKAFDHLANGRDKWTVIWRSGRVIASISFDAAYLDKLGNFTQAMAFAKRQQKWMSAGGA